MTEDLDPKGQPTANEKEKPLFYAVSLDMLFPDDNVYYVSYKSNQFSANILTNDEIHHEEAAGVVALQYKKLDQVEKKIIHIGKNFNPPAPKSQSQSSSSFSSSSQSSSKPS
jgi:hypothetical protein